MKIYLKDLECYKNSSKEIQEHRLICKGSCFDLGKLNSKELRTELCEFVFSRGREMSLLSIRTEIYPFNQLCEFLNEYYPDLKTLDGVDFDEMERKAIIWLSRHSKQISYLRKRPSNGKLEKVNPDLARYIRRLKSFVDRVDKIFDYAADRWYLDGFPVQLRENPSKKIESISFEQIKQNNIKEQLKKVIYVHLSSKAVGTVAAEMTAINRFAKYIDKFYPDITSLLDMNREIIESYLIHTNTEANGRKNYEKELRHLKSIFVTAAKVFEDNELNYLFYVDDFGRGANVLYRIYSDKEIKRLNESILDYCDNQVARALFIHQLLGLRISETLTLKRDAVYQDGEGRWKIKIYQIKSRRYYEKVINEEVKRIFDRSCEYTQEKYGLTEYLFVYDKDPSRPMTYARIQYQLMTMINKYDLKDDNGERFTVGTHIWRHSYGQRLTDMNVDDAVIAKLLGHANTSCLKAYRRVNNKKLSDDTRKFRESMDEKLSKYSDRWNT